MKCGLYPVNWMIVFAVTGGCVPSSSQNKPATAAPNRVSTSGKAVMQGDLGKTASDSSFQVVDLTTPEKFREILLWDISIYSGHDKSRYYVSSAATPKGLPRTRVYAIGMDTVSKEWLKKVLEEKKVRKETSERERKASSRPLPQVPLVKEWLEWQEKTNLVDEP